MNIYFSGIGGVGIGPLAEIALDAGYSVTGSDRDVSHMAKQLMVRGVYVDIGTQSGEYLESYHREQPIDWFVYTSALPTTHPELVKAKELGIKTAKRDELIALIIKDKGLKLIAIAGTHGKTTSTGMMVWALKSLDIPVSYSIGSTINFGPSGSYETGSQYFVYECDEFDRNFLNFEPELSLITSIDYDHPDTYPSEQDYLNAFSQFGSKSKSVICWNNQHLELFNNHPDVMVLSESDINGALKLPGQHNRKNATLVQKGLIKLGLNEKTDDIMNDFPGTNRRFEKIADNIYSDYGHHPVEIAATLQMAKELNDNVVLVYQPHQNIRQHNIKSDYTNQFELANKIYWVPTYLSREDPNLPVLTPQDLIVNVTNKDKIIISDLDNELWHNIEQDHLGGALILCMGAGSIDGWLRGRLS